MKAINIIALILIIVGAINWGLWGFFQYDFVAWLTGSNINWLARTIYAIIGLAGIWSLSFFGRCCKKCCKKCSCGCNKNK